MAGWRRRITAWTGVSIGVAATLAGCGSAGKPPAPAGNRIAGLNLTVYVAAPLTGPSGPSGEAVVQGATLALDRVHARVGRYRIQLRTLDDVPAGGQAWSGAAATLAAQTAAANPTTIAYLGDLNSGASAISIPILNRLAIAQVSPYSGAVGLTSDGLGSSPGEPQAYYPTTLRTFARVVPSDYVQAKVQVALQRSLGCSATYVLSDGEYDADAASEAFTQVAAAEHFQVVATQTYVPTASSYTAVGQTIAGSGANCVLISAIPGLNAVPLVTQVAAVNPGLQLFATSGLAETAFVDPAHGGIAASLADRLLLTVPTGDQAPPRTFASAEPVEIDAYAAMQLLLEAIRRATDSGRRQAQRIKVVHALFGGREHVSVLGRYRIGRDGDTSLDSYGVYRVRAGELQYWKTLRG